MIICFWTDIIFCFKNPYKPYAKQKIKSEKEVLKALTLIICFLKSQILLLALGLSYLAGTQEPSKGLAGV